MGTDSEIMKFLETLDDKDSRYLKAIVQAIVSNINLSFCEFDSNSDFISEKTRVSKCLRIVRYAVEDWFNIENEFDKVYFPEFFIESAIFSYNQIKSVYFLDKLNLKYDKELALSLKNWLKIE